VTPDVLTGEWKRDPSFTINYTSKHSSIQHNANRFALRHEENKHTPISQQRYNLFYFDTTEIEVKVKTAAQ
jgi:hypothetical protein